MTPIHSAGPALCRVYLLTYRRHHLLPRALNSLLNQTVSHWVCELHNDDPTDAFPGQLVEQIGDPRITLVNHSTNFGATRSFNQVFQPTAEPFISLLEDDNWWQPDFLETMLTAMVAFPTVQIAWSNMQCWQETSDGSWIDTGKTIWPLAETAIPRLLDWGQPQQMLSALHSNGAMLLRSRHANQYQIPDTTPFESMEAVRERTFPFPILFVPQVCANFAMTQTTARSSNPLPWAQMQVLLAGSFLHWNSLPPEELSQLWQWARSKPAKSTTTLFFAAFTCPGCWHLLQHARISDWLFFLGFCLKHPIAAWQTARAIDRYPELWQFLNQQTELQRRSSDQPLASHPALIHSPFPL